MQEKNPQVVTRQTNRDTGLNTIMVPCQLSYGTEKKLWIIFIGIKKSRIVGSSTHT